MAAKAKKPTTELVTDRQKRQAALKWLTERARSLSEATGIDIGDMGSWLLYEHLKETARKRQTATVNDRKAAKRDKTAAAKWTPAHEVMDARTGAIGTYFDDIAFMGAEYDDDYQKPLLEK